MLKWLRTIDWAAVVGSTLVLAFFVLAVVPHAAYQPNQERAYGQSGDVLPERVPPYETETFWVFMGFIVTCVIATYGIREFHESRKSREHELRAYVFPHAGEIKHFVVGQRPLLNVKFTNFGETPAYNFKQSCRGGYDVFPVAELPKPVFEAGRGIPVAPGDFTFASPHATALTQEHLNELNAKTHALYFQGRIEYLDAFGKKRWVNWCYYAGGNIGVSDIASYKPGSSTSEDPSDA